MVTLTLPLSRTILLANRQRICYLCSAESRSDLTLQFLRTSIHGAARREHLALLSGNRLATHADGCLAGLHRLCVDEKYQVVNMWDTKAERCRHSVGHIGSAGNPAGSQPGDSDEVPDIFASLFRFAGVAEIQRHSHRILRNHRAAPRNRRGVWPDGLFGHPPHARNWRACRSRGRPR